LVTDESNRGGQQLGVFVYSYKTFSYSMYYSGQAEVVIYRFTSGKEATDKSSIRHDGERESEKQSKHDAWVDITDDAAIVWVLTIRSVY